MTKLNFVMDDANHLQNILGEHDRNLNALRYYFDTEIIVNAEGIFISATSDDLRKKIENVFLVLSRLSYLKLAITERDVTYIASLIDKHSVDEIADFYKKREPVVKTYTGKGIYPKTFSQMKYLGELDKNDVIIAYGVAGVGKTFVAVSHAVKMFKQGYYSKIILSRPVVEAGESLGFLPGEIKEKIDPYLIPLYDSLYEIMGKKATDEYIENGIIEIAPLAYMRGRTLENAYVILDEAQNTTKSQMKLFLTRMGFNAKMVVTGDLTQVDLPKTKESGLSYAVRKLSGIPNLKIIGFEMADVVRNPLVQKMLERMTDD